MKNQGSSRAPKNISVFLRVRPPIPREAKCTCDNLIVDPKESTKVTILRKSGGISSPKSFYFNKVFSTKATQLEVYNTYARGAVDAAFDGQHGVLFVYGQTGSGKSFTVSNEDPMNLGVLQQSLQEVWMRIANDKEHDYTCSVSYVQLYNEILTDLLDQQKGRVRIQLGPEGRGDVVLVSESSGLTIEKAVKNYDEAMECFRTGMRRKEMASTQMNSTSSRSHTIFNLNITRSTKVRVVRVEEDMHSNTPTIALEGRLVICDLAGSERVGRSQAEGKTLDEATHINGSLLVLGKVVAALTEKKSQHAPFRESKLTRILQYSLLGNGNTSIIVNVSPSDDSTEESWSSILFGQRAIQIKQDAKRHEVLDYKALYLHLMAELDSKNDGTLESALLEERDVYGERIRALEDRVKILTAENDLLRKENTELRTGAGMLPRPGSGSDDWLAMNKALLGKLAERDGRISTITDEQLKLGLRFAEERWTVFRLAKKLDATMIKHQMDRCEWTQRIDELGSELARLKGTDYINFNANIGNDGEVSQYTAMESSNLHVDPKAPKFAGRSNEFMQEQLEKSYEQIRALQQDRNDLLAYQTRASRAIRMLHEDREALAKKVTRSS